MEDLLDKHFSPYRSILKEEMDRISNIKISGEYAIFTDHFKEIKVQNPDILGDRNDFIWKWLKAGNDAITLSSVNTDYFEVVNNIKGLQMILAVLLDDLADKLQDSNLVKVSLQQIPILNTPHISPISPTISKNRLAYIHLIKNCWNEIDYLTKTLPNYNMLKKKIHKEL